MGVIATAVKHLIAAGVTGEALVMAIAELEDATPKAVDAVAERRRAYDRQRKRDARAESTGIPPESTGNADPSLSLPPNEINSNPPTHTHPDNNPPREGKTKIPAKPAGVKDRTWADFLDLRKRKRATLTETAMAGIEREAAKAGWSLEDALAESVTRGWQAFKADWVDERKPPTTGGAVSHLDYYLSKKSAGATP